MKFARQFSLVSLIIVISALCTFCVWKGLGNWFQSSNFGRSVIRLADGTKIYAVRQTWGHRRQIFLTLDPDGCKTADPNTDYILMNEADTVIVYRVTSNGLILFSDLKPFEIQQPVRSWAKSRPTVVTAYDPEIEDLVQHPQQNNVVVMDVFEDEVCIINLFRIENSLYHNPQ